MHGVNPLKIENNDTVHMFLKTDRRITATEAMSRN